MKIAAIVVGFALFAGCASLQTSESHATPPRSPAETFETAEYSMNLTGPSIDVGGSHTFVHADYLGKTPVNRSFNLVEGVLVRERNPMAAYDVWVDDGGKVVNTTSTSTDGVYRLVINTSVLPSDRLMHLNLAGHAAPGAAVDTEFHFWITHFDHGPPPEDFSAIPRSS